MTENISLVWLGADFLVSLVSNALLVNEAPTSAYLPVQIAVSIVPAFALNILFFGGQTPTVMFLHAVVGGLVGWWLLPYVMQLIGY